MKQCLYILLAAFTFASCKKETVVTPAGSVEKKLIEIKNISNPSDWEKREYNSAGRLIKAETDVRRTTYEYLPSRMLVSDFGKSNGQLQSVKDLALDANGHCIKQYYTTPAGDTLFVNSFEYDAAGFMVKYGTVEKNGSTHLAIYTINNGNIVKGISYENGVLKDSTNYFYDMAMETKSGINMMDDGTVKNLFGARCKNAQTGFKRYNPAGVLTFDRSNLVVQDADHYMIRNTSTNNTTGVSQVREYFYQ